MLYEFQGCDNPSCQAKDGHANRMCLFEIQIPISKAPAIGSLRPCPVCKTGKVQRIISSGVTAVIKGEVVYNWSHGERMRTKINGEEVAFKFVDHPHTDPKLKRNLAAMASRQGITQTNGLGNARYDEKLDRMVVDVESNVKDPLGKISRAHKRGDSSVKTTKVNQPYKKRSKKKG